MLITFCPLKSNCLITSYSTLIQWQTMCGVCHIAWPLFRLTFQNSNYVNRLSNAFIVLLNNPHFETWTLFAGIWNVGLISRAFIVTTFVMKFSNAWCINFRTIFWFSSRCRRSALSGFWSLEFMRVRNFHVSNFNRQKVFGLFIQ